VEIIAALFVFGNIINDGNQILIILSIRIATTTIKTIIDVILLKNELRN